MVLVVLFSVVQSTYSQLNEDVKAALAQHLLQGSEHYENAKYREALHEFDQAKKVDPDTIKPYYAAFWVYYRLHDGDSALKELQQSSAINKAIEDSPRYLYLLAAAYELLSDITKQKECLQKLVDVEMEPTIQNILIKGKAYDELEQHEQSLKLFKKAVTLIDEDTEKPLKGQVYWSVGHASIKLKDYETAIKYFKESLKFRAVAQNYDSLGTAYRKHKDHQNAIKNYRLALKNDPLLDNAWAGLGRTYRAQGKLNKAKRYLEKGLEVNSLHGQSRQHLIHVFIDLGKIEEAKEHIKILREQTMPDQTWQKRIAKCLARIENK